MIQRFIVYYLFNNKEFRITDSHLSYGITLPFRSYHRQLKITSHTKNKEKIIWDFDNNNSHI